MSGPGYQGGVGTSSSSQSASTSQSQTTPNFSDELYSEGQSEIKSIYQGRSMTEPPVIELQGAVPERKKVQKSPTANKEPGTPTEEGGSTSASTSATTLTRRKASTKVTVACDFCRGEQPWFPFDVRVRGSDRAANCNFPSHTAMISNRTYFPCCAGL